MNSVHALAYYDVVESGLKFEAGGRVPGGEQSNQSAYRHQHQTGKYHCHTNQTWQTCGFA